MTGTLTCPACGTPVIKLSPSPRPTPRARPHLVATYPCNCWHPLPVAAALSAAIGQAERKAA